MSASARGEPATSSAMVPSATPSPLAELDRTQFAQLVENLDEDLATIDRRGAFFLLFGGLVQVAAGISSLARGISGTGIILAAVGGLLLSLSVRQLAKGLFVQRSLQGRIVAADARRLFGATVRARQSIRTRVARQRAAMALTPRRDLLIAAVEAELGRK
jgi:hypothetical protein